MKKKAKVTKIHSNRFMLSIFALEKIDTGIAVNMHANTLNTLFYDYICIWKCSDAIIERLFSLQRDEYCQC